MKLPTIVWPVHVKRSNGNCRSFSCCTLERNEIVVDVWRCWKGIRKHGDGLRLHLPQNHWYWRTNTSCFKLHLGRSPRCISIVGGNFGRSTFQVITLVYPPGCQDAKWRFRSRLGCPKIKMQKDSWWFTFNPGLGGRTTSSQMNAFPVLLEGIENSCSFICDATF